MADANYLSTNNLRILVADKAEFCVWDKTILYQPSITIKVINFEEKRPPIISIIYKQMIDMD